jgi:Mn-dependent DtxR family transcriptional regulator
MEILWDLIGLKNGYCITDTAERLGIHPDSLRNWIKRLESPQAIQKHKILDCIMSVINGKTKPHSIRNTNWN